jgi:hypothetical protein
MGVLNVVVGREAAGNGHCVPFHRDAGESTAAASAKSLFSRRPVAGGFQRRCGKLQMQ